MHEVEQSVDITYNNIRISSMASNSGVFTGHNLQHFWSSDLTGQSGFGAIIGEGNILEHPFSIVTDPDSSDELLEYFEEQVSKRFGKRGI